MYLAHCTTTHTQARVGWAAGIWNTSMTTEQNIVSRERFAFENMNSEWSSNLAFSRPDLASHLSHPRRIDPRTIVILITIIMRPANKVWVCIIDFTKRYSPIPAIQFTPHILLVSKSNDCHWFMLTGL